MTRRRTETNTIQIWPSGASFTYRGDPYGPDNQRSLRIPGRNGEPDSPWRKGSPEEWRLIRIAVRAELYARREILICDSSLVDALISVAADGSMSRTDKTRDIGRAFEYDRIENLYADPSEWTLEQCREYLSSESVGNLPTEGNVWRMDRQDLIEHLANAGIESYDHESDDTLRRAVIVNIDDGNLPGIDDWREACRDHAQDNPAEVFEWWRVSEWLCQELRAIGQVVIDNDYGTWWGRCTTGQGFIMDGVLQQVAARHEREAR